MTVSSTKHLILRIALVLSWLLLAGWLIRFEAFPEYFSGTASGYQSLIPKNMLLNETWMSISMNGVRSGYTRNVWNMDDANRDRYYINESQMHLDMQTGPVNLSISTDSSFNLDQNYNLKSFDFRIGLDNLEIYLKGKSADAGTDAFDISLSTTGTVRTYRMSVPRDTILFTPIGGMASKKLKPGQSITINSIDPFTLKKNPIVITALRREEIKIGPAAFKTTLIASKVSGLTFHTWIDQSGEVVKHTSPFGLVMERTTMDETMDWMKSQNKDKRSGKKTDSGISSLIDDDMIRQLFENFMKGNPQ